ncbi:hypothetical protein Cgig2_019091 [Carnegiea gigantea]|uniref:RNase H type-1 domain-containing protein n=1 Tax=Carnegiea gigantea TaxID=171969 RepID=A0A9Q1QH75_9CARY|nr:hypothetical protein Cgig2_019091 [Carnegiea gigantea]
MGVLKLNFDGGKVEEDGWGWGFVVRSSNGDICLVGVQQGSNFFGPILEKAKACLCGLRAAREQRYLCLAVEGDCLPLIQKLKNRLIDDNVLEFIIRDILALVECFEFVSFLFVKRGGNRVAHNLAHWQPISHERRVWVDDVPERIVSRASDDISLVMLASAMKGTGFRQLLRPCDSDSRKPATRLAFAPLLWS